LNFYNQHFISIENAGDVEDTCETLNSESIETNENFVACDSVVSEKFKKFETFFYDILYNLYNDTAQIEILLKLQPKEQQQQDLFDKLLFSNHHGKNNDVVKLEPLNFANLIRKVNLDELSLTYNKKEAVFFTKVMFINKYTLVTLSEQPYNEIRVWRIESSSQTYPNCVRSMKLKRAPRELKLFNAQQAVALLDRNLHLLDLNKCVHLADLNSTMNPNLPLFEIHDPNHVVILARNRLTVTLMKLPLKQQDENGDPEATTTNSTTSTVNKTSTDDMFLFKVGEDRYLKSMQVSKNGKMMVCGDEVQKPFPLLVWDLKSRKLIYDLRMQKHEFITSIQSISSSGKYVVCACQEDGETTNCLIVYDLTTGKLTKNLKGKANYCSVEISEELDVIIACLENSQIIVYDLSTGSKK
jgi:WD40 repeat protein